jgi:hypothetical protein
MEASAEKNLRYMARIRVSGNRQAFARAPPLCTAERQNLCSFIFELSGRRQETA